MHVARQLFRRGLRHGLLIGGVVIFVALAGLIEFFSKWDVIDGILSVSVAIPILLTFGAGYLAGGTKKGEVEPAPTVAVASGGLAGILVGVLMGLLALLVSVVNIRSIQGCILVNATPELVELLTFGLPPGLGVGLLIGAGLVLGMLGAAFHYLAPLHRRAIIAAIVTILVTTLLREFLQPRLMTWGIPRSQQRFLFQGNGLSVWGALILLGLAAGWVYLSPLVRRRGQSLAPRRQQIIRIAASAVGIAVLLALPFVLGEHLSDVLNRVGVYIVMGLGLNIVVGIAGLLDLGYVAFFAIGAYLIGYLTSADPDLPNILWSWWAVLPLAIAAAALAGVILGVPVLRMRGDYLAIVTLGFGEIISRLVKADLMKPITGGAQGIDRIPKPSIFGLVLRNQQYLYYLIFVGVLLTLYISARLIPSRVGRAWMAMRDDEDVAEAVGVHLVSYKLLAFATGAAFAGLAGALFAAKVGTDTPANFDLLPSINVLCLIIVGGMGSNPGVIVGAFALVGLPELLQVAADYRMLFYGALLVVMMLARPEGLWPARRGAGPSEEEDTS